MLFRNFNQLFHVINDQKVIIDQTFVEYASIKFWKWIFK